MLEPKFQPSAALNFELTFSNHGRVINPDDKTPPPAARTQFFYTVATSILTTKLQPPAARTQFFYTVATSILTTKLQPLVAQTHFFSFKYDQ